MLLPLPSRHRPAAGEPALSPMPPGVVLLLHIGYWAMYLLLMGVLFALVQVQVRSPSGLVALLFRSPLAFQLIVPNAVAFYIAYGILAPRYLATRRFGAFLMGALAALGLASAISLTAVPSRTIDFTSIHISANRVSAFLIATGGLAALHMTVATIMRGFVGWYDDFAERDALRRRTTAMEVALMRATLDPHFLFNTLNNIDTLITRAPDSASLYLTRLSELLRFVLYDSRADLVPLESELDFLDKYVALQRLRLKNPDTVTSSVRGPRHGTLIAPMLLVPFVENAFKHASGQRAAGAIAIDIAVDGSTLRFTCANRYDPARHERGRTHGTHLAGGLGNDVIRRRLELLYAGRFTLLIDDRDAVYSVHLTVELAEVAPTAASPIQSTPSSRHANALPDC